MPFRVAASALPAIVTKPSTKSVGAAGISSGLQRRRLGVTGPSKRETSLSWA